MELNVALKTIRKAKRLSLADMCSLSQMGKSQYTKIENGKHKPSRYTIERLMSAMGVPVWHLYWLAREVEENGMADWEKKSVLEVYPELEIYLQALNSSYEQLTLLEEPK